MANILTAEEAARVVGEDETEQRLLDVLPQVDAFVNGATGYDWTKGSPIDPEAKNAARLQLALTYDLMSMQQSQIDSLNRAIVSSLTRLEAKAAEMQAIHNANSAVYADDMLTYLTSDVLGLNLVNFDRLSLDSRKAVVNAVLSGRPENGYADINAIQAALDAAVKAVLP